MKQNYNIVEFVKEIISPFLFLKRKQINNLLRNIGILQNKTFNIINVTLNILL